MPYICAKSVPYGDGEYGYPQAIQDIRRAHKYGALQVRPDGTFNNWSDNPCDCAPVWISDSEYDRRVQEAWNRVLGFPRGYQGSHYNGYRL